MAGTGQYNRDDRLGRILQGGGRRFTRDAGRMVEDMKAFVAEHEPAKGGAGGMSETLREAEAKAWDAFGTLEREVNSGVVRRAHHDGFKAGMEHAARTPDPATARFVATVKRELQTDQDCSAGYIEVPRDEAAAFVAEHEPAGPR